MMDFFCWWLVNFLETCPKSFHEPWRRGAQVFDGRGSRYGPVAPLKSLEVEMAVMAVGYPKKKYGI